MHDIPARPPRDQRLDIVRGLGFVVLDLLLMVAGSVVLARATAHRGEGLTVPRGNGAQERH